MLHSVRLQRLLRPLLGLAALALVAFVLVSILRRPAKRDPVNLAVAGVDTQYFAFDEKGRQAVRLRCRESRWGKDDKLRLIQVSGSVARHGRMNSDVRFRADGGALGDDFNYFLLEGSARIIADDVELSADRFLMAGRKHIFNRDGNVSFRGRDLEGVARRGLEFYTDMNIYKLLDARGELRRQGRRYAFRCDEFFIMKDKAFMQLVGHAQLQSGDTLLEGGQIVIQFSADFETLSGYTVHQGATMDRRERMAAGERQVDLSGSIIECFTEGGCLTRTTVFGPGIIRVVEPRRQVVVTSDRVAMGFGGTAARLQRMTADGDSRVDISEKRRYSLFGRGLDADFGVDGDLQGLRLESSRLLCGQTRGEAPRLEFDALQQQIRLQGEPSLIQRGENQFVSSEFLLDIATQALRAERRTRATVMPAARSAVLDREPMFLTADRLQAGGEGEPVSFSGRVTVLQETTELTCARLDLDDRARRTSASGGASLRFRDQQDEVRLAGETILLPQEENRLTVQGAASLQQGENGLRAERLDLLFGPDRRLDSIRGDGQVSFVQDRLNGQSQELLWRYRERMVIFRRAARISRLGGGTSQGPELQLNLATREVLVRGQNGRTETVLKQ